MRINKKDMAKEMIQLTEQDLHQLVEDAVRYYITENSDEEGLRSMWAGLKGAASKVGGDARTNVNNAQDYASSKLGQAAQWAKNKAAAAGQYVGDKAKQVQKYGQAVNANFQAHSAAEQIKGYIDQAVKALSNLQTANTKLSRYKQGGALVGQVPTMINNLIDALQSNNVTNGGMGRANAAQNTIWNSDPTK